MASAPFENANCRKFLPDGRAQGLVTFSNYAGCGTAASVDWSATRR